VFDQIDGRRRRLLAAATTIAMAQFNVLGSANAKASPASRHARGGGIGHNPPQEAPQAFASAIIDVSRL
jgi:pimeloyl-ACP methyl ester carboxylesterase